ncbi:3-deoxy-7-phosphoheptulonate synthase [Pontibacter aydingkolensis]|uniref:chorismate mutase n=1 Tax=Pontibacter aydingkolensis TaxID=1911536 RepID=A0ABS7CX35_9BACT|nr:prephenate dehydrogenase [Pontibacter aydingkolensis]MBW7468395.1 prephenate dehydrogenase [Pontibacter aydingkolensis]
MIVGIVGTGLIGGSMALDLKQRGFANKIIGADNNPEHLRIAKSIGIIQEESNLAGIAEKCDLIIVATPVDVAPGILLNLLDRVKDDTIILDVGSTKEHICKAVEEHSRRKQFVACHPIAGTENTGPEAAHNKLFDNKVNIICNAAESDENAVKKAEELFSALKMDTVHMEAREHDRHIAFVSHLSHITSFALGLTVLKIEKDEKSIFNLAGSGFASTVRLAKSSPDMWAPILGQNARHVSAALDAYIEQLLLFKETVDEGLVTETYDMISTANQISRILDGIELKNRQKPFVKPASKDDKIEITPISDWLPGLQRPLVISGPCSAETEAQVMETCQQLAATGKVDVLRAGIWKPRTRPNNFEGIGTIGLEWLKKAKEATGMKTAVEVANKQHVEEALKYGVDILWIGARTTVNPFSVQEIADALQGIDIPVLVKNPINADLELWIGAIERLSGAGITKLGAIHRGFAKYGETKYRNAPQWQLPIELKRRMPELPMICDPSHICGNRELLAEISQQALDLNYTGLMLESHINPDKAWSDAKQQVTPERLAEMIDGLVLRNGYSDKVITDDTLQELRNQVDQFDSELLTILSQRMQVVENIGQYKKDNRLTILQASRWNDVLDKSFKQGEKLGLSRDFIEKYLKAVHQESINHQSAVMNEPKV